MKNITKILIANRGEIAARIVRACKGLGIQTVAAVSEADQESLPARMADRAVCIGPSRPLESYLKIDTLIAACLGTGSDAIHPGYGFLAEQPELVEACKKYNIRFIGPTVENIRQMGNKLWARRVAEDCGIPTIPGSEKVGSAKEAAIAAGRIGFPVLLKAAAGGGGRGMKIVKTPNDLEADFDALSAEVRSAFGDGTLYMEHFIPNARHIEIQILGDHFGNVVHLGERDCSVQRRYQKMIEEAPSPVVSDELRNALCQAAVTLAKGINYESAGTVEFIIEQDTGRFFFLEMNTRIQVEHPVTEQVTGIDLIREQIRIADFQPIPFSQEGVRVKGHAIECRINAESPEAGFSPSPGRIESWAPPQSDAIRIDTHCHPGYVIPPFYDSLIAKLVVTGKDRPQTIARMRSALNEFDVSGVETNISFHKLLMEHPDFIKGEINTRWLEDIVLPTIRS
jgi:acetyl-CoA carboxylase, biotin carboxylase subunit